MVEQICEVSNNYWQQLYMTQYFGFLELIHQSYISKIGWCSIDHQWLSSHPSIRKLRSTTPLQTKINSQWNTEDYSFSTKEVQTKYPSSNIRTKWSCIFINVGWYSITNCPWNDRDWRWIEGKVTRMYKNCLISCQTSSGIKGY